LGIKVIHYGKGRVNIKGREEGKEKEKRCHSGKGMDKKSSGVMSTADLKKTYQMIDKTKTRIIKEK